MTKEKPVLVNFDPKDPEQEDALDRASYEDHRAIQMFLEISNGGVVYCKTCKEHHVVPISEDGTCLVMGACGAWSWKL